MQDRTTRHEITVLKSPLRLPLQVAPIDRTMTSSVVARGIGVEPAMGLPFYWPPLINYAAPIPHPVPITYF